jgi:hypothetical protein
MARICDRKVQTTICFTRALSVEVMEWLGGAIRSPVQFRYIRRIVQNVGRNLLIAKGVSWP